MLSTGGTIEAPEKLMKNISRSLQTGLRLLAVATGLLLSQNLQAAVTFTVTPPTVSNTYNGTITLQIAGLTNGETVLIQKYLNLSGQGVLATNDWLVQQFNLTDGQPGMVFGGVTNFNVPGDTDATAGQITAVLNFQNGDFIQNIAGAYLFKLSSPVGHFSPLTNQLSVTNFPYAQKFTGTVVSNGSSTVVPNAVVLMEPQGSEGGPKAGVVANSSGNYTLPASAGTYGIFAVSSGYLFTSSKNGGGPELALAAGQTLTTNLTITNATASITGSLVDANNSSLGLPGVLMYAQGANGLMGISFTQPNGSFSLGVLSSPVQWDVGASDTGFLVDGYLRLQDTNVNVGTTGLTLSVPKGTALFYGSVQDNLGNPVQGVEVQTRDNTGAYKGDSYSDANGNYVTVAVGGLNNDTWQVEVNNSPANYLFSEPSFDQNGGANISAGEATEVNITAILATNTISGYLTDGGGNPIAGINVYASTTSGANYNQNTDTGANGYYSISVANGQWQVGVSSGGGGDSLPANYLDPQNQNVVIDNNNATVNFTAPIAPYTISGSLKDGNGNPLPGIGINAYSTSGVSYNQNVDTDANGDYSLGVANGTWQVGVTSCSECSDSLPAEYFCPPQTVVISNNNATVNLIATISPYTISGFLKDNYNNPIAGVNIYASTTTASGANFNENAVTGADGSYSLNVVNGDWQVGVNSCTDCSQGLPANYLGPQGQSVVVSGNSVNNVNFTAILAPYTISGSLEDNYGNPIAGVNVYAYTTSGSSYNQNAVTGANGDYSIYVINGNWQVGVNSCVNCGQSLPANYLDPASQPVQVSNDSVNNVNFTAILATNAISGSVRQANGSIIPGVGVSANATINNVGYSQYVDADPNGNYSMYVANGSWSLSLNCNNGGSDSLDNILGSGNYACPNNQSATISGNNATVNFIVQSCGGISILGGSPPNGQVGVHYDQFAQASSCNGNFTWSLVSGSVPPGLTGNANGELYGTPTTAGTYTFTIKVTDGAGLTATETVSMTIIPEPLLVATTYLPYGEAGVFYSQQLQAVSGQTPYTWSLTPGSASPPLNLTLTTNGLLSGTPASSGTFSFSVRVTDSAGATADQLLSLLVGAPTASDLFLCYTNNGAITITNYIGGSAPVFIPANINGWPVATIGNSAFTDDRLTGVVIPDSVTSIGDSAFSGCVNLTNVTIGSGVTSIGDSAFNGCSNLASVTIGSGVISIGDYAFELCTSLISITIPNSVTSIGVGAFFECHSLASVTIANSVTSIGDDAFESCTSLTSVYFLGNAPTADSTVFYQDTNVTVYYLPGATGWLSYFAGVPAELWGSGSLQVTISPQGAINAGAQWQVDGGPWLSSGATTNLLVGSYTVSFSAISGWTTPSSQLVSITSSSTATATGTYSAIPQTQTGALEVTIDPPAVVGDGAEWQVDGGAWQSSGAVVSGLSVSSSHILAFNSVFGWTTPANQTVSVTNGTTNMVTETYALQTGALEVTIGPPAAVSAGAEWQVDGGAWQTSGAVVSGLVVADNHIVAFTNISGWTTPANQTVFVTSGTTTMLTETYALQTGALEVTIDPPTAVSAGAEWQVDGGAWRSSGAVVSGLPVTSNHIVVFTNLSGWTTPANQTVSVTNGTTNLVTGTYLPPGGSLEVTITPTNAVGAGAMWQVDGGAFQISGAVVAGLSSGNHTVSFNAITGWDTPSSQTVTITNGTATTDSGVYKFKEKGSPTLTITSPKSTTSSVSNEFPVITGTTKDKVPVAGVYYQLNGADWAPANSTNSWATWFASVTLTDGPNTLRAYAVDISGSAYTNALLKFKFIPSAVLDLKTNGLGFVTPNDGGKLLAIKTNYTLTATPGKNWIFSSWVASGSTNFVSNTPVLKFAMQSNLTLQANFVTNVFLAAKGTYIGLFAPTNAPRRQTNSGAFKFTVTSTGALSGKLTIGTDTPSLTGQFNPTGFASFSTPRKGLSTLTNTLQLDFANQSVQGTIGDGSFLASLLGDQEVFSSSHKAADYEGSYTFIIPGTNDSTVGPFGTSYGTATVGSTGTITYSVYLADGTSVLSQSSVLSEGGFWPFYLPLYGGNGSLWSWNYFNAANGTLVAGTNASWINEANPAKAAVYRAGFTNQQVGLSGSSYNPSDKLLLSLTNAQVLLEGGNLPFSITNEVTWTPKNTILLTAADTNKLTLTINKTSGVISGSFANPSSPKDIIKVNGVLLQNKTNAQGYFLGTDESGTFLLENENP